MVDQNPYAAPTSQDYAHDPDSVELDPKDRKKVDAVIKDASQFWLAIVLCILCSAIGAIIIPIWYLVRLFQWNSLATKYPALVQNNPPFNSLQSKFKSSQWKLIVGMVVGAVVFICVVLYLFLVVFVTAGALQ